MNVRYLFIFAALLLAGCSSQAERDVEPAAATMAGAVPPTGKDAYIEHCAGCHETGLEGAPVAGDRAYWEKRSKLWQAVLEDHAKTGYLDMPAKGGRPDLSDSTIDAAVEYMLSITFPEMPPDQ